MRDCSGAPNCVCSTMPAGLPHAIEPFRFPAGCDATAAWTRLVEILERIPRLRIVEQTEDSLRAECRTRVFRFVDVLEFELLADESLIHVRSESQTGYWDLGVNRRRMEEIRHLWDEV